MKMKVMTWNIMHGEYLEDMLGVLVAEKADILCVQEIGTEGLGFKANSTNTYELIRQKIEYHGIYEYMFSGDQGEGVYSLGVAIYSRFPIIDSVAFSYERAQTEKILDGHVKDRYNLPRKLLGAKLDLGGKELWLFNTHFTITPDAQPTDHQLIQAREVRDFLSNYDEFVFCGDMNTAYGTETYRILSEGMVDVSLGEEPTLHPTLHSVGHLKHHVDYVFVRGERWKWIESRVPVVDGSDHLPVVVEIEVD